ncbi:hypothetical protein OEZ85_008991 [Tetradesmus obliquus]|uniref:Uncharacterized protein n=1 Tax=Tetradesmus obliquus TaxID=3088 RepID=A0ABY8TKE9_TETOB|nr:hypothetical protein OEZ85_008991 [Tetradesmus obliquus]
MDVEGVEPNTELAGLVDTFLDTHSKSPKLVAAQTDIGPLPDNSEASFFLAQGLKSLVGGNIHAALHRLSRAGPGQQLELASSLIKVADVCRALYEHEEAEQLLRTAAGVCFEVQLQAAELAPGTARKLQVLLDVLHAQGSAAAC